MDRAAAGTTPERATLGEEASSSSLELGGVQALTRFTNGLSNRVVLNYTVEHALSKPTRSPETRKQHTREFYPPRSTVLSKLVNDS